MNKAICSLLCLLAIAAACNSSVEARPKRSVYVAAAPVVATVPVVQHSHVVHSNPTSVVKTEQVRSGDHASYSYTSEVKTQPIVHTHTHAAQVVAAAPVATAVAAVPHAYYATHAHYGYYPSAYSYYSPYSYVIGK